MTGAQTRISVLVENGSAWVRIVGRATFAASVDFKTLIAELSQKGFKRFVLDLSECALMDSTFLGVLAGFGLKLGPPTSSKAASGIELFNPNPRVVELLESLGVLHLFGVLHGEAGAAGQGEQRAASPGEHSKQDMAEACLEAHEVLIGINPGNAAKFKELTAFLAEDIKRLKANSG